MRVPHTLKGNENGGPIVTPASCRPGAAETAALRQRDPFSESCRNQSRIGESDMLKDLVLKNRSYRRFHEEEKIETETLRELVQLAQHCGSGGNVQPLRFVLSNTEERNQQIFPHLGWAGYLKDWPGPEKGERPSAYIVILQDRAIVHLGGCDHGIAAQTILLGATERGLGGCTIGNITREELQSALRIDPKYEILLVLALGKPKERVVIEYVDADADIKYWRDKEGVHHVPKRKLDDLIVG